MKRVRVEGDGRDHVRKRRRKTQQKNTEAPSLPLEKESNVSGAPALHYCTVCNHSEKFKSQLERHIINRHTLTRSHACDKCGGAFRHRNELLAHTRKAHPTPSEAVTCEKCGKLFKSQSARDRHVERVHDKPRHVCHLCGLEFSTEGYVRIHVRSAHEGIRYACSHCGKTFIVEQALKHHVVTIHEGRRYDCRYCPKRYKTRVSWEYHESQHVLRE